MSRWRYEQDENPAARITKRIMNFFMKCVVLVKHSIFKMGAKIQQFF